MRLMIPALFSLLLIAANASARQATVPSATAELAGPEETKIEVRKARTGHLLVKTRVNDRHEGWFIFDTGAGMTCVDRKFAKTANLPDAGAVAASGNSGTQATRMLAADSVQFGRVRVNAARLVELDLDSIATAIGHEVDGVIGYECFFAGVFEIDAATPSIHVHDVAKFELPAGEKWHAIQWVARRPAVRGQIEALEEGLMLLDLGANSALTIRAPSVQRFKLLEGRETLPAASGGVGGMQIARKGTVSTLQFAGHTLTDVPTIFSQASRGALAGDDVQAVLGVGILGRFVTVLDYRNERLAFVSRDD